MSGSIQFIVFRVRAELATQIQRIAESISESERLFDYEVGAVDTKSTHQKAPDQSSQLTLDVVNAGWKNVSPELAIEQARHIVNRVPGVRDVRVTLHPVEQGSGETIVL